MRPKAVTVKPLDNYKLYVGFDNGETRIYDVTPLIKGDWYGQLRNPNLFKTVHIAGLSIE